MSEFGVFSQSCLPGADPGFCGHLAVPWFGLALRPRAFLCQGGVNFGDEEELGWGMLQLMERDRSQRWAG